MKEASLTSGKWSCLELDDAASKELATKDFNPHREKVQNITRLLSAGGGGNKGTLA